MTMINYYLLNREIYPPTNAHSKGKINLTGATHECVCVFSGIDVITKANINYKNIYMW